MKSIFIKFYKYLQNIMAGSKVTVPQLLEVLKRKDDEIYKMTKENEELKSLIKKTKN